MQTRQFQNMIRSWYRQNGRHDLPWRKDITPYRVLVSEFMLQQTQVSRVVQKYYEFLLVFPTLSRLAQAPYADVLRIWSGLGYNRRALFLRRTAEIVVSRYQSRVPADPWILQQLPGIGPGTAGAIAAFAFDRPHPFIETNIRRVYLHHFFSKLRDVADREVLQVIAATLPSTGIREWYWALMDYGAWLGRAVENANKRSRQYVRQKPFHGSKRELRGRILRIVLDAGTLSRHELSRMLSKDLVLRWPREQHQLGAVLKELVTDGFILVDRNHITVV